jgi:hypothetical protein
MTCKDCIHYEACDMSEDMDGYRGKTICEIFKDKSHFIEVPCNVGDTVYYPFAGKVLKKKVTSYVEVLRKSGQIDRWYCVEFSGNETFTPDCIGKIVYLTEESALQAIKEKRNDNKM